MSTFHKKRKYWTHEEDVMLQEGIKRHGNKWTDISKSNPQLAQNHPGRTALKDRAVVLKKHMEDIFNKNIVTNEIFDNMPDSSRIEWTHEEEEALKDAWYKHHTRWQDIWNEYGPSGNGALKRHKKENLRYQILKLQKKQMNEHGHLEERLKTHIPSFEHLLQPKSTTSVHTHTLGHHTTHQFKSFFQCNCGKRKNWSSLLSEGLKCICDRSLLEMIKQIEEQIDWVVYIILDKNNQNGLSGDVDYVGIINKSNVHDKEFVENATFHTLRASVFLGESQLMTLLHSAYNMKTSGNKLHSNEVRFWKVDRWIYKNIGDVQGQVYEMNKYYGSSPNMFIPKNNCFLHSGIVFTNINRSFDLLDDELFCFKKNSDRCHCDMKCTYRKILNALQDKPIWDGIPVHEVKDVIKPYKQVVKVIKGEKNPTWDFDYCNRVIHRNDDIRESTKRDYFRKIKTLWENDMINKEKFIRPWELLEDLRRKGTRNTAKSIIVILMSLLSHITNAELLKLFGSIDLRFEYMCIQKRLSEEEDREVQQKTEREKRNWVKRDDIEKAIEKMEREADNIYKYQRVVWYKMQTYMGPARNEWQSLKVMNFDPCCDNYVDLHNGKLILNTYKTSDAMGRREFEISHMVKIDIERLVKRRIENGIEYMFTKMNGKKFKNSEFSNAMIRGMEKYLHKRVGSQMHRKIYVTEEREGEKRMKEKKEMSGRMLHSERMSERYRRYD